MRTRTWYLVQDEYGGILFPFEPPLFPGDPPKMFNNIGFYEEAAAEQWIAGVDPQWQEHGWCIVKAECTLLKGCAAHYNDAAAS